MSEKKDPESSEVSIPIIATPPEITNLHKKLDEADENIEFVLGEVAQREGIRIGGHFGFIYGILAGLIIVLFLKFVFNFI